VILHKNPGLCQDFNYTQVEQQIKPVRLVLTVDNPLATFVRQTDPRRLMGKEGLYEEKELTVRSFGRALLPVGLQLRCEVDR